MHHTLYQLPDVRPAPAYPLLFHSQVITGENEFRAESPARLRGMRVKPLIALAGRPAYGASPQARPSCGCTNTGTSYSAISLASPAPKTIWVSKREPTPIVRPAPFIGVHAKRAKHRLVASRRRPHIRNTVDVAWSYRPTFSFRDARSAPLT